MRKANKSTSNNEVANVANTPTEVNAPDTAPKVAEKVQLKYIITQAGKNPFNMEFADTAKASDVTLMGLARKTGYAIADSLHNMASKAIAAKLAHGDYITSFRPKAVFKVSISVNNMVCFHALASKGLDAIRICDAKGELLSRKLIVDKFELIAEAVQASHIFGEALKFVEAVEKTVTEPETITA